MSRLIAVCGPEAGAVRCEHLIAKDDITVFIQSEFEFGICDNDAAAQCVIRAFFVKSDGVVAEFLCVLFYFSGEVFFQVSDALLIGNVFVMLADLCFCGWSVDGLRQFVGFF